MTRIQHVLAAMLFLATTVNLNAQTITSPLNQGYWTLGLNGGKAYQSSDVNSTANSLGLGLTLGKNIYHRPGGVLDFGLQGRLGYSKSTGLNAVRNYNIANNDAVNGTEGLDYRNYTDGLGVDQGFIFSNHKTNMVEAAIEGVVTLNELKEKTGVKVALYGGLGVNYFNVETDQAGANDKEYFQKYAELDHLAPTSLVKKNLREAILDGDYESYADGFGNGGKAKLMPSIGIEAGFQVTPKFAIDFGHRTTFSGTDLLDGEQWIDGDQDILHYTYLGTTFNFNKKENRFLAPIISVYEPRNAALTNYRAIPVYAKIENAESAADVQLLVNGKASPFRFRKEKLSADIVLQKGENQIEIIANTFGGEDRVVLTTFFEEKVAPPPVIRNPPVIVNPPAQVYRPVIEFIGTARNGYRIRQNEVKVAASVRNVFEKRDIVLFTNGRRENFRYDTRREEIEATIRLLPGENEIILRAFNEAGETEDRMLIIFEDRLPRPLVNISQPSRNFTTRKNEVKVVAETEFIADRREVFVTVNGRETYNVEFANDCVTAFARLKKGRNVIRVRVENESGSAEDEVIVFHEDGRPELREPTVKIIKPTDHATKTQKNVELVAEVFEVARKRDIELFLNDVQIRNFEFRNNRLTAALVLEKGSNKILLRAANQDGRDEQIVMVKFQPRGGNTGGTPQVKTPTVDILSPKNNVTLDKNEVSVKAKIKHTRKADVFVNGTKLTGVKVVKGEMNVIAKLKEGRNEIKVIAKNQAGIFEKKVTVIFKKKHAIVKVKAPTIEITRPTDGTATEKQFVKLIATVKSAKDLKNIEVILNGKKLKNVTLKDGELTALLALKKGKNNVEVKATNKGGTTVKTLTVTMRDKIQTPVKRQQVIKTKPSEPIITNPVKDKKGKTKVEKIETPKPKPGKAVRKKLKGGF